MKTKPKLRARRMWANYYSNGAVAFFSKKRSACLFKGFSKAATVPVTVIPLDNVEQIVLEALYAWGNHKGEDTASSMRAALTAIGVLPKPRKGDRK
jgi:hypothetical protein